MFNHFLARFWSKDHEAAGCEEIFLDYLNNVSTLTAVFFAFYVMDGVLNDLIHRREYYKQYNKKKEPEEEQRDEEYLEDESGNRVTSRGRRLEQRNNKRSNIDWNDDCYVCGEPGDLICCDTCPNVAHLECVDLKVI